MISSISRTSKIYSALIAAFIIAGLHFYLGAHFYELQLGLSSGNALCNVNKILNCDTVAASSFASLWGVPMALWGFTTQLITILFFIIYLLGLSSDTPLIGRMSRYLTGFSVLTSVVMATISILFLKAYCLFCIAIYALSLIQYLMVRSLTLESNKTSLFADCKAIFSNSTWIWVTTISIVPLGFFINGMFMNHFGGPMLKEAIMDSQNTWLQSQPSIMNADGLSKGDEHPSMTIVEFADFLCPHCKHAAPTLKIFVDSHPNVKLIFKAFPLDGTCNPSPNMPKGDGLRCYLAKAVHCAESMNQKGWDIYDAAFEKQQEYVGLASAKNIMEEQFKLLNLDVNRINSCIDSEDTHQAILQQAQEGLNAKIEGTPSIFVNNRYLPRGQMLSVLQKIYDSLDSNSK